MNKVIISRIHIRTHEEEAAVKCEEQKRLSNATYIILLEDIKDALVVKAVKHHAEDIFKDAHRRKHVEEPVLCIVAIEPEIARIAIKNRPENPRNEYGPKQHPKRTAILLD